MKRSIARASIDPYEAIDVFLRELGSLGIGCEEISVENSLGRVACSDAALPMPLPPFPRSIVDGYAALREDIAGASRDRPARLRLAGRIDIGDRADHLLIHRGSCYEVATGSHLPRNTDLVIPVEYTEEDGDEVLVYRDLDVGSNIAYPGSDMPSGSIIVMRGWVIDEKILSALSSAGIKSISVYRKPRACIIVTGRELLEPGEPYRPGMIYESNLRTLSALLSQEGFEVEPVGVVGDSHDEIAKAVLRSAEKCDLIITTGGTSAGSEDYVYRIIDEAGRMIIRGIKYKPGKPLTLGIVRSKPVIGLPGNPVSVIMLSRTILQKLFQRIRGVDEIPRAPLHGRAKILRRVSGSEGRLTHIPSILIRGPGGLFLLPWVSESYMISRLSLADVYIEIHYAEARPLEVGEEVEYRALRRDPRIWVLEAGEIASGSGVVGNKLRIFASMNEAKTWLDMGAASTIYICENYSIEGNIALVSIESLPSGEKRHEKLEIVARGEIERIPGYKDTCFSEIVSRILVERGVERYKVISVESIEQSLDIFSQGLVDIALKPLAK